MGCFAWRSRWLIVSAPGLGTLRGYQRAWLRWDLIAGVTVVAYLVPQVMAYAGLAGLSPVTGLWAALPPLACYAVLGSSRLVSLGPESTTALMTAVTVGPLAAGDPARYAELATVPALLVGALAVVAWLVRLGFVADLLSRPVVAGYLAGVAQRRRRSRGWWSTGTTRPCSSPTLRTSAAARSPRPPGPAPRPAGSS